MATTFTETPRDLAFVLSEANGYQSREVLTIASGSGVVKAGTVVGKITVSGKYVPSPAASVAGKEGAETALAICGYEVDATSSDVAVTSIANDAEVKTPMLVYDASVDDATKRAAKISQLRSVKIKAR